MSLTTKFGANPVKPQYAQYLALTIAANTPLVWPIETAQGVPYVAAQIDVTATAPSLELMMPDATQGGTGVSTIVTNVGGATVTVTDVAGNPIAVLTTTQSWLITLTDNSTTNGTWRALQLASTTSSATAAALAGAGLQANGSVLQSYIATVSLNANTTLDATYRAELVVWTAGIGVLQMAASAALTPGWWVAITNEGTGAVQLTTTGGDTFNGAASGVLQPGSSVVVVCTTGGFNTYAGLPRPLGVASGGTGADNPTQALINLGGTTIGIGLFTAPTAAAALALLGINITNFTESTVNTNQVLNTGSTLTVFVCTAALSLTLPLTTTLTTTYAFMVYAQGGAVTVTPNVADQINAGTAGANFTLTTGQSAFFCTDAAGNWWPLFVQSSGGGGGVTSVGLSAPGIFTVTGSPVTTTGTLAFALSNAGTNLIFAGPGSGGAAPPTFRAIVNADIPTTLSGQTLQNLVAVGIGMVPANPLDITVNAAGAVVAAILNNDAGGTSFAGFRASNGTHVTQHLMTGTGFTPTGVLLADGAALTTAGVGGWAMYSTGASSSIRWAAGGTTEQMRLTAAGALYVGYTADHGGGQLFQVSGTGFFSGALTSGANTGTNGFSQLRGDTTNGAIVQGKGSVNDFLLQNAAGTSVFSVGTGTTTGSFAGNVSVGGTLGVTGLATVGGTLTVTGNIVNAHLSGTPTAPTQASSDNSTNIATTAYVKSQTAIVPALGAIGSYTTCASNGVAAPSFSTSVANGNTGTITGMSGTWRIMGVVVQPAGGCCPSVNVGIALRIS